MNHKNLPHRFSENAFRKYEHAILATVEALEANDTATFNPEQFGVTCETFAQRIRDAMRSYLRHGWPSGVDKDKLRSLFVNIVVRQTPDGLVNIYHRKTKLRSVARRLTVSCRDIDLLKCLFLIVAHKILPYDEIVVVQPTASMCKEAETLAKIYDVAIKQTDTELILI